jgi:transcriptional regulator with XRE-family HTH domain
MSTKNKMRAKTMVRKMTGPITFGEMLYSIRMSHEVSQVYMARELSISKQDLCNIEKGRKAVSVERALLFANALGMPVQTFVKYALQDQLIRAGLNATVEIKGVA